MAILTNTRELAADVEVEAVLEVHRVSEGDLLRGGEINLVRAVGVEGQAAKGLLFEVPRALGVGGLHRELTVRCAHVGMGQLCHEVGHVERRVAERERDRGIRGRGP